jgi:hypothetical protein
MASSGKLLAVTGSNGIEIFWFNGASPMKAYKTLLSGVDIEHAYWDNANYLYAISQDKRRLYVFTVTTTSTSQAPGSPHSITGPQNIIVQPRRVITTVRDRGYVRFRGSSTYSAGA